MTAALHFARDLRLNVSVPADDAPPPRMMVLQRVEDNPEPFFPATAQTPCVSCGHFCHLGEAAQRQLATGTVIATCTHCADAGYRGAGPKS